MLVVAAAPIGKIPHLGHLLASEAIIFNEVFAEASVDIPSPAFTTTRAFLARIEHGVVICRLSLRHKFYVVIRDELFCESGFNVIRIIRNFGDVLAGF